MEKEELEFLLKRLNKDSKLYRDLKERYDEL